MDYSEKKYEQAFLRAKKLKETCDSNAVVGWMEYIFPELKESEEDEDEKIRKGIIIYVKNLKNNPNNGDADTSICDKWIAWLEKQGEHSKFYDSIQVGDKVTRNKDGVLVNLSQLNRVAKKDEKQGEKGTNGNEREIPNLEQKSINDLTQQEAMDIAVAKCFEQGEQKPADKVESKFEIGDWVVYDHRAYQVVELPKEGYINLGLRRNGKIEFAPSPYCRLWTIQDAKDGDVLVSFNDKLFIYNGKFNETSVGGYCGFDVYGNFVVEKYIKECNWTCNKDIKPATKEQRDQLEKAMADAGYTFDFEKKELKKIEQKPAWSEEDEYNFAWLYETLIGFDGNDLESYNTPEFLEKCKKVINWFKCLKERYSWQPSDEQMDVLLGEVSAWTKGCSKQIVLESLYNDLKKLK